MFTRGCTDLWDKKRPPINRHISANPIIPSMFLSTLSRWCTHGCIPKPVGAKPATWWSRQSLATSWRLFVAVFFVAMVTILWCNIHIIVLYFIYYYRRKFRSQTSDNMERWKAEQGRGTEKRKIRREKIRRERVRGKTLQMREKVGKSRKHCVFPMIWGSRGSKSRLAKAAGAEPAGQMRDEKIARRCGAKHISKSKCTKHTSVGPLLEVEMSKKCTPLWREAHFQVKMYKTHQVRTTFGSWDVEKVHAVVARSTFRSQNVQNTPASDHFWKLRCWKSARRCGAKHISKSKVLKTDGLGPLLEVQMSKKCRKSARRCGAKHISKSKV